MDQTFIKNLSGLRQSDVDTVLQQLNTLFLGISKMNEEQVIAAFQTVRCTAELCGLTEDVGIRHVLKALHQRMVALVNKHGVLDKEDLARTFCAVLAIELGYSDNPVRSLLNLKIT